MMSKPHIDEVCQIFDEFQGKMRLITREYLPGNQKLWLKHAKNLKEELNQRLDQLGFAKLIDWSDSE